MLGNERRVEKRRKEKSRAEKRRVQKRREDDVVPNGVVRFGRGLACGSHFETSLSDRHPIRKP